MSQCAELRWLLHPPQLAKLACFSAAKPGGNLKSSFLLPSPACPPTPSSGWTDKEISVRKITPGVIKR